MRLRSKVGIGTIALTAIMALGKCSAPLIETAHAQERATVSTPVEPAQPTEAPKPSEQDSKPKTGDTRPADCPSVVYEPDERCGLERRPWKGGPISEEELRRGEEALIAEKELWKCLARLAKKEQTRIDASKRGIDIPGPNYGCNTEFDAAKGIRELMSCGLGRHTNAFELTNEGIEILVIDRKDIFIKWNEILATLAITIQNENIEYTFKLAKPPRYAALPTDRGKTSELVIWNEREQIRINLDESCRPVYDLYR